MQLKVINSTASCNAVNIFLQRVTKYMARSNIPSKLP